MLDLKKDDTNNKENPETVEEENVAIHTMQEDLDALSGIFSKNNQENVSSIPKEEKGAGFKENSVETKEGQYFNPFLEKQTQQEGSRIADFANKSVVSDKNISQEQETQGKGEKKKSSKKLIWIIMVAAIIGSLASGGYYFFTKKSIIENESQKAEVQKSKEAQVQKPENSDDLEKVVPSSKYSFDKPNYLAIDTENPSYDNFKEVIDKAFLDIKSEGISKPVEFVIVDNKNNPIAFSIFSAITKLKLSNELLKNLNDEFSLLAYYDSANPRLALSIKVIDDLKASSLIKNEEVRLPAELMPLFLYSTSLPKEKVVFKDGNYKGINIRYFNLTADQLSTIDYSFNGGHLIIGTSKNSMWAILDKVLNKGE